MNEWIDCKDRLPIHEEWVIACGAFIERRDGPSDENKIAIVQFNHYENDSNYKNCSWFALLSSGCGCCDTCLEGVTHWMPLPKSPEVK